MRGHADPQGSMFSYFSPESRVPAEHPLRAIKRDADAVLGSLSREFDELYAETGRPSSADSSAYGTMWSTSARNCARLLVLAYFSNPARQRHLLVLHACSSCSSPVLVR